MICSFVKRLLPSSISSRSTQLSAGGNYGAIEGVEIFHAGTKAEDGSIVANGGRVLNITALRQSVREAQSRAYEAISRIRWPEGFCRHDIGWRAIEREKHM
jgi:phosphoribosylamine---glycine ligase